MTAMNKEQIEAAAIDALALLFQRIGQQPPITLMVWVPEAGDCYVPLVLSNIMDAGLLKRSSDVYRDMSEQL